MTFVLKVLSSSYLLGVDDNGSLMAALYEVSKLLTAAECPQDDTIVSTSKSL